jgi:hypothetical protein
MTRAAKFFENQKVSLMDKAIMSLSFFILMSGRYPEEEI